MNLIQVIKPAEFLEMAREIPVIDVRSPSEFRQGHIPGAVNIALFEDSERAVVGTTYTKSGRSQSILKGLELVGPKLADYVRMAREHGARDRVLVHCWRGGMRSEAMAWLFSFSGMETLILQGGYKAYRRHIRKSLESGPPLMVIGGMTGSGKTELLQELASAGEQVIDLEAMACHKGSAFGGIGQGEQPTTEQFENNLADRWMSLDPGCPAWLEDESLNIGKVILPAPFFAKMRTAPLVYLDVPFESRVHRLLKEYGDFDASELQRLIRKISRRMGNDRALQSIRHLEEGDVEHSITIVLEYYDKTYRYAMETREKINMEIVVASGFPDYQAIARHLKTTR